MAGKGKKEYCGSCNDLTTYICIDCSVYCCNKCSVFEENEESKGWQMGKSVGRCKTCTTANKIINNNSHKELLECETSDETNSNIADDVGDTTELESEPKSVQPDVDTSSLGPEENESETSEGRYTNVNKKSKKGKCGRKATWSTDSVNDLVDIITSHENYQKKLIFTNTKNQNNGTVYGEVLHKLKERASERGEQITFTIQQIRTKFKRCVSDCKHAAMTIKTATGIKRFQDEKGYGKWFDLLFPLVKTRDSCRPSMAVEPSAINDPTEEEEVAKTFEDFVPRKRIKLPKKNMVAEAVDLLKQVVEKDPAKELITFMQEEAEKARKHELQLVELMLKHNSNNNNVNNFSPPHNTTAISPTAVQGMPHGTWNTPHQYFSFQSAENPMYNMSTLDQSQRFFYPSGTSGHGNSSISQSQTANFQR